MGMQGLETKSDKQPQIQAARAAADRLRQLLVPLENMLLDILLYLKGPRAGPKRGVVYVLRAQGT